MPPLCEIVPLHVGPLVFQSHIVPLEHPDPFRVHGHHSLWETFSSVPVEARGSRAMGGSSCHMLAMRVSKTPQTAGARQCCSRPERGSKAASPYTPVLHSCLFWEHHCL